MKNCVVAVDLGATSGRVILSYMENGRLISEEISRFENSIYNKDGKCFWNIDTLFGEIISGINKAITPERKILSIGVDTWGVDVAFIDKNGKIISDPRAYRDPYTEGAMSEFFKIIPRKNIYEKTGIQFMNFNTLFQLFAASKENYTPLNDCSKIVFIPDLVSYMLTGKMVCEYTILSTSQFLNPVTKDIEDSLLEPMGLNKSFFPEIVMPGTVIGMISKSLLDKDPGYDIPVVAVAGHDTASAVAAVPAMGKNFAYLSSGTWSLMGIETEDPIINDRSEELNFTNEGGIEGTTRFLKNITGMWILEQCRKEWKAQGTDYSYPEIVEMIEKAEPFKTFINPDDPGFANPQSMTSQIESYCKKHGLYVPQTHAEFVRAIMESLALRYRTIFEFLKELSPFPIDKLHIIGGGAKNKILNQFTANSLGVPVYSGPSEATAIGNIMIQFKSVGIVSDIKQMRELISQATEVECFKPQDTESWNEAYKRYIEKCN